MKETRNRLLALFGGNVMLALLTFVLFEAGLLPSGEWAAKPQEEFVLTTVMELLTLGVIPLALKLFHFGKVRCQLKELGAKALAKWGTLRICLVTIPLILNTIFYELFMRAAFGYLAIILVLCLPFIFPSMKRCLAETEI